MDSITDPLGQTTLYEWCTCGALAGITDPNQNVTTFNRDLQSRLTSKVFADQSAINYTYENTTSRLKSMTDAQGQVTNYQYYIDDNLKRVSYSNALNATPTVSYFYDSSYNRVTSMADGMGLTNYTYYPVSAGTLGSGQLHQVSGPFSTDTITYSYDQLGRVTGQNINGTSSSVTYDSLGRVSTTDNPLGHFSRAYELDVTPRLHSLTYPNGQTSLYNYFGNSNDRRLQTLQNLALGSANLSRYNYTYNPEGQILTWNKLLGAAETDLSFSYDAGNQLTDVVQVGTRRHYDYDATGNRLDDLFSGRHIHGGNYFSANNLNQLDSVIRDSGVGPAHGPFPITYDANGNMTYDGNDETFEWDAANRLVAINRGDDRTEFAYDGMGQMRAMGVIGTNDDAEYTATVQPADSNYTTFNSAPITLHGGSYQLTFQGLDPNGGYNTAFIDAVKLNGILVPNGSFETPSVPSGYYDSYIDSPSGAIWTFSDNSSGAGITGNDNVFTENYHVPDGVQAAYLQGDSAISQTLALGDGTYTLSFFAAQRLYYQPSYQQVRVDLAPISSTYWNVISGKTFVWSGNRMVEERDSTGATTTKRYFAEGEQRVGGSDAGNYYYTRDHLGSIREVTNATGNLITQLDYDAWGNEVVVSGGMNIDFGFTGHYFHQPSGLNLAIHRPYNPLLARWISRDPIGETGGLNLYGYVGGNTVSNTDPFGLAPGDWWDPRTYIDQAIGKNWGQAWRDAATEPWVHGPTGGYLPQSLANGLQETGRRVSKEVRCPQANGMHAWHAGSNAYLAQQLGLTGAPLILLGGLFHESPLDWQSFKAEQYWQGSVNHLLDSMTDIASNFYGMAVGYTYSGKDAVGFAMQTGNYIPGPGEPDPAFGGTGPYKGNPADAWGQYP